MHLGWALALLPSALVACFVAYGTLRALLSVPELPRDIPSPADWPRVSVVVPACNEADHIQAALSAKLSSDYENIEIVVVDDRSTDDTPNILRRLAQDDDRVRVVRVDVLKEGWLGKLNALNEGVRNSSGQWLLFSDADIHLSPDVIRRAVAVAEAHNVDYLTLIPHLTSAGFWLDVAFASFMRTLVVLGRLWRVSDPSSSAAVGGGPFNLVRRSALDRSPGFEHLRLEAADDVGLGQMMKTSGARSAVFNAPRDVSLAFYRSVSELMHGLEKNGYAVLGAYRPVRHVLSTLAVGWIEAAPIVVLAAGSGAERIAAGACLLALVGSQVAVARWTHRPVASACVPVVGAFMLLAFMSRAAVLAHWRGGIVWRGTFYPLEALRRGRRLWP